MNAFRISLLAVLLFAAPLRAQDGPPAPDAPLPQHVDYLLRQAETRFAALRGGGGTSSHRMRVGGVDAPSRVHVTSWVTRHVTVLPAAPGTQDSVYRAAVETLRGAVPSGWSEHSWTPERYVRWRECPPEQGYRARFVSVQRTNADRADGGEVHLEVFIFRDPCDRSRGGS